MQTILATQNKHGRILHSKGEKMLKEFVKQFTEEEIVKEFVKINNECFFLQPQLKETLQHLTTKPSFIGTPLGRQKGQQFQPSLYLLQKLAESSNKKITVNEKGAWMFICGKDIFGKTIIKVHSEMKVGDNILVQNHHGECLGYGKVVAEIFSKGVVVQNEFDIGDFFRRERLYSTVIG